MIPSHLFGLNEETIIKFGKQVREIQAQIPMVPTIPRAEEQTKEWWALYWMCMIACCQHTAYVAGVVNGKRVRGTDYLFLASQKNLRGRSISPDWFLSLTEEQFVNLFLDDEGKVTLDRVEQRFHGVREAAAFLQTHWAGSIWSFLMSIDGKLEGKNGLFERLQSCTPYSDPEQKKSRVLALYLQQANVITFSDFKTAIRLPVDYHVERVALRLGLIEIQGAELQEIIREGKSVPASVDNALRNIIALAADQMLPYADIYELNSVLWHLGRGYCFREHAVCSPDREPAMQPVSEFEPKYGMICPARSVCPSHQNTEVLQALKECNITTSHY